MNTQNNQVTIDVEDLAKFLSGGHTFAMDVESREVVVEPIVEEPKVSLRQRLAPLAKPVTVVGHATASAVTSVVTAIDDRKSIRVAVKQYNRDAFLGAGRALRAAAKMVEDNTPKGGE